MAHTPNQQACLDFLQEMAKFFSEDDEVLQEYDDAIGTLKTIFLLGFDPENAYVIAGLREDAGKDDFAAAFRLQAMLRLSIDFEDEEGHILISYVEGYEREQVYMRDFGSPVEALSHAIWYGAERWLEQKLLGLAGSFNGALDWDWDGNEVWKSKDR